MTRIIVYLTLLVATSVFAQDRKFTTEEVSVNSLLNGTLYQPDNLSKKTKLVIIIAGSGIPDRNGNMPNMSTNSYKYLAESLAKNGNAVYAFDKRTIAQIKAGNIKEEEGTFEDFITDVKDIITYFKAKKQYSKIVLAGHSEGSLVGMIAAKDNADAYISLAGMGRPFDEILVEQIGKQAPFLKEETQKNFDMLKKGKSFELKTPALSAIFRKSVQPYLISILKYNPVTEIKKLHIPILIINGTKDIQVPDSDAKLLHEANPKSEIAIIENMNHIFKEIKGDTAENQESYNKPDLPIMPELSKKINSFLSEL